MKKLIKTKWLKHSQDTHTNTHTHNHNMKVEPFHLCAYCEYKALHKASL